MPDSNDGKHLHLEKTEDSSISGTQDLLIQVCDNIKEFLLEKNKRYGDSAINPIRFFSKSSAEEQLLVRLDDKVMRIKNGQDLRKNDIVDLVGYLILLLIKKRWVDFNDLID